MLRIKINQILRGLKEIYKTKRYCMKMYILMPMQALKYTFSRGNGTRNPLYQYLDLVTSILQGLLT